MLRNILTLLPKPNKFAAVINGFMETCRLLSKRYSLIIIPESNEKVINSQISRNMAVTILCGISLFVFASIFFTIGFIKSSVDKSRLESLVVENQVLASKIGNLENTVYDLHADMSDIMKKDDYIRLVFDIQPLDSDFREVGIGGTSYGTPTMNTALGQRTWLVEEDIAKLQRQLELENASFADLHEKVIDKKNILDHTPTIRPCKGSLSRGFGMHNDPFTGAYQPHRGIDIAAPKGTPVQATAFGVVDFAGYQTKLGNTVIINHGNGVKTYYGHLSKINVRKGQRVDRRDIIGLMGSTGYSTGSHLHYEVKISKRAVNPYKYIVSSILS